MQPELEKYIEEHISPEPAYLTKIDRRTNQRHINGRMCSGHIQGRLLKMLTAMISPKRVLELGTFTGYSTLCIAEALGEDGSIDTVEINEELKEEILENFSSSPFADKINLYIGDALDIMASMEAEKYDMIFIDADKRLYPAYLELAMKLTRHGGFILADNTLWDSHVVENGKHSSQTKGIIEFNHLVRQIDSAECAIMPVRDGLTLIQRQ